MAEVYQGNGQDRYDEIKSGSDGDLGRYEAQHYKYPKLDDYGKWISNVDENCLFLRQIIYNVFYWVYKVGL